MKLYLPGNRMNKPYIAPNYSTVNEYASLAEEFIYQVSHSQDYLISSNASKY